MPIPLPFWLIFQFPTFFAYKSDAFCICKSLDVVSAMCELLQISTSKMAQPRDLQHYKFSSFLPQRSDGAAPGAGQHGLCGAEKEGKRERESIVTVSGAMERRRHRW